MATSSFKELRGSWSSVMLAFEGYGAIIGPCPHRVASRRPGRSRKARRASSWDRDKQALAYIYFENEPGRRLSAKLLTRDEAFLTAVNITKLPSVPRQILKDIPKQPNSASRDD
jgi:hypothetical protein